MTDWDDPVQAQLETQVMESRRGFPTAEALLGGAAAEVISPGLSLGWYGTAIHPERGPLALVDPSGPYADLVGDVLAVSRAETGSPTCFVYVVGSAKLPEEFDLMVTRRAYLSLSVLAVEPITARVEKVG